MLGDENDNNPVNTIHLYNPCTMLDQRRRLWVDAVQMLYECFVFARSARRKKISLNTFSAGTDFRRLREEETAKLDIYDEFKLKKSSDPYGVRSNIAAF